MTTHVLRIPYRITDLRRNDKGHWIANVNGQAVFRTFGSWQTAGEGLAMRDVLPYIAADLQECVRRLERAERKAARVASSATDVTAPHEPSSAPLAPSDSE